MKTRKYRLTRPRVASLPRSFIYKPLAVVMAILLAPALSWMEGGGGAGTRPFQANAQTSGVPTVTSLSPSSVTALGPPFILNISGTGFSPGALAYWNGTNGTALTTTYVSATLLNAAVPASLITAPGSATIVVVSNGNASSPSGPSVTITNAGSGCASTTNSIIRNYCVNGRGGYLPDLTQFENDSVTAYLTLHNLPQTDAHVIYDYGRSDLRSAVRGVMMSTLQGIFAMPASQRTPHQQNLYNWMQSLVHGDEISLYQNALSSFHSWQADPCHFGLDPTIASVYKLTYDGNPYCYATETDVLGAQVPAESYFTAYGLKKSYGAAGDTYSNFGVLVKAMGLSVGEVAGITAAALNLATDVADGAGVAVAAAFIAATVAYVGTWGGVAALAVGPEIVLGAAGLSGATVVGAALIPLLAAIIGIVASIELFTNVKQINSINTDLTNALNNATNTQPDLNAMATDTSGLGFYKLEMALGSQTVPEVASTTALPTHQATDLNFAIQTNSSSAQNVSSTLSYKDWNGNVWSAQTWGGWFVQTCANGSGSKCDQGDSIIASIHYVDASGAHWTASRMGNSFVSIKASPRSTDQACAADSVTLVSLNPDPTKCSSYVSNSIPLVDGSGNDVNVSLSVQAQPTFTSPALFSFAPGAPSTQTITAFGNPAATICLTSSSLPSNFTLNGNACGNGTFQIAFDGGLNAPVGDYSLAVKATSSIGSASQTVSIKIATKLAIVSPISINGTAGMPISFAVVATGNPTPTLSLDPQLAALWPGLTLHDNGNGTGIISGIYAGAPGNGIKCTNSQTAADGTITLSPCGIIATSGTNSVEQSTVLNMATAPGATIAGCPLGGACPTGATFIDGIPNQVTLTSTGAVTPVSWNFFSTPPAWLNLTDNGNGTAVLSGTPPPGTTGTFDLKIVPTAAGSTGILNTYPLTMLNVPVFTSPNSVTFTVGTADSFPISATMGAISGGNLPQGLSFVSGNPASITGTPAAGTGGQYTIALVDDDGTAGTVTQSLILNVNEGPKITSANMATMFVGMPGSFAVTTTGFPSISNHVIPANPQPPTDPSQGDGMYFTVTGLPADLTYSNLNSVGLAGGTLTIQSTPTTADVGMHQVQITAQNGVGVMAQQTLALNILALTGPAPTSGSKCNGNYNGTFKGSITVSAGQNCAFYGGGVNGNVAVNGGHLALNNATISGNLGIQGGSGFSIGQGSKISGNVTIQSVASGSTTNQICGASVSGNLQVLSNAIPIQIGNPQNSCYGSSIANNVAISGNTGPVAVYDNTVGKNLSCSSNASISGAGNSAQQKGGQCTAF